MSDAEKSDIELWRALDALDEDLLDPDFPIEHADAVLRTAGLNEEDVQRRGTAFVASLAKERRLSWQARAREKAAQFASLATPGLYVGLSLEQLREEIAQRLASPGLGPEVAAAFRSRDDNEMNEDELRDFLMDIDSVLAMSKPDSDG